MLKYDPIREDFM